MPLGESAKEDALRHVNTRHIGRPDSFSGIADSQRSRAAGLFVGTAKPAEVCPMGEIMPNNIGRISGIAIALSSCSRINVDSQLSTLYAFLRAKGADETFSASVIYDADYLQRKFVDGLERAGIDSQISIQCIKSGERLHSIWIRDGAVRKGTETILLPCGGQGAGYEDLAQNDHSTIEKSNLFFEGGDVRTTASHVFLGIQTVYKNILHQSRNRQKMISSEDIDDVVYRFEQAFGKKIIVVGLEKNSQGTYRPLEERDAVLHTDMIVTPLNENDILLAKWNGNAALEKIGRQLRAQGFNIIELPYEEFRIGLGSPGQCSYNNVLLEEYGGTKKVYLPQYCARSAEEKSWGVSPQLLRQHNDQARGAYERCGYSCVPIEVSLGLAKHRGSLNCLTFEKRARE